MFSLRKVISNNIICSCVSTAQNDLDSRFPQNLLSNVIVALTAFPFLDSVSFNITLSTNFNKFESSIVLHRVLIKTSSDLCLDINSDANVIYVYNLQIRPPVCENKFEWHSALCILLIIFQTLESTWQLFQYLHP